MKQNVYGFDKMLQVSTSLIAAICVTKLTMSIAIHQSNQKNDDNPILHPLLSLDSITNFPKTKNSGNLSFWVDPSSEHKFNPAMWLLDLDKILHGRAFRVGKNQVNMFNSCANRMLLQQQR